MWGACPLAFLIYHIVIIISTLTVILKGGGFILEESIMKLNEIEKVEGIGNVTEAEINAIKTEEHKEDEFIGLKVDEEVEIHEL